MATIRRRRDKWQVQIRRKGFSPQTKSFHQQRDAERWATLKEREFDSLESRGLQGSTLCDMSVEELLARYRGAVVPLKRGATREAYMVSALERTPFANVAAQSLTADHVRRYRDQRLKTVSAATVVRELGILQHAFNVARTEWGFSALCNPTQDVTRPKLPRGRTRRLLEGEEGKLLTACGQSRNPLIRPIMTIALETAMRANEILTATWDNYDASERVLLLPITKNGKQRTVALSRAAIAAIESQPRKAAGPIFPTSSEALKRAWRRLTKRAGISDLHFHDLRHEAISRLFELGLDIPEVMMMSGHTDHRMLLRYTHLTARRLVSKLG